MKSTLNFKELSRNDASIAGGKGASLGEMTQAGIPVPPGFIVTAEAFATFLKETDLLQEIDSILHKVNHKEIHTIERASEEIRELILNAEMPKGIADEIHRSLKDLNTKYVAVRSSATAEDGMDHAWAGQLESYLTTTEDQVLTKEQILELSEIILQIEKHYGFPCDIEWAYEAGKFYIVQCRPITTLNKNTIDTSKGQNSLNYEFINSLKNRKVIRIEGDFIPFLIFVDWLNFYKEDGQMSNIYPYVFYFSKEKKVGYVTDSYSDCARYTFAKLLEGKMVITEIEDKYNKSVDIIKDKYNKYFLNKTLDNQT